MGNSMIFTKVSQATIHVITLLEDIASGRWLDKETVCLV